MKDIPFFTTESGVASLTLHEIPYKKQAFIRLQQAADPESLLEECSAFCKMAGAERLFATGHSFLEKYPLHTKILEMACSRSSLEDTDACLFPLTEETLSKWQEIYNQRMKDIPNAATMTAQEMQKLCVDGGGYFIHRKDTLLGIGFVVEDRISVVISVVSGAGKDIVHALNHALTGDIAHVEVASENTRAVRLYEKLGFVPVKEISSWYQII